MTDNEKAWGYFSLTAWKDSRALCELGFEDRPSEWWLFDIQAARGRRRPDLKLPESFIDASGGLCVYSIPGGLAVARLDF
ncbi:MAG: hypothetical protein C4521_09470 [Actinobacteria bacterium]|nr:MAG: hypothetical protein C4521_09470 [Actinomycetota bacterium]